MSKIGGIFMKEYPWYKNYDKNFPKSIEYPEKTMYELVKDTAIKYPQFNACSFMGKKLIFLNLIQNIDIAAGSLLNLDINPGDVVTICLPNTPHAVIAFYAINKIGCIANMVHPLTPAAELEKILESTNSKCLFVLNAFLPKYLGIPSKLIGMTISCEVPDYLSPIKSFGFFITKGRKIKKVEKTSKIISWSDFLKKSPMNYEKSFGNENIKLKGIISNPKKTAVYLHSGGTTGSPKTIMLSSENMNVLALQGPAIIGKSDPSGLKMASILPLFHGFGLCMGIHTMMVNGVEAVLVPLFSAQSLAELLTKEKPNYIAAVPTLLEGIMKNKKVQKMDLSFINAVFCGGDTLTSELKRRFDKFLEDRNCNAKVREGYGLTETVTVCSVNPIEKNREGTIGLPLADIEMKIVELNTIKEVPTGEKGEICITGPTVMLGYLNDSEGTSETIKKHEDGKMWVHSGDYGYMDEGGYFYFIQRMKRIIKVSGMPVFPSQIEDVIAKVEGVSEVSAIGIAHPYKMQVVKVFVSLNDEGLSKEEMRKKIVLECENNLIKHAIPAEIEFMDKLPRTKVGKIDTMALEKIEFDKNTGDKK